MHERASVCRDSKHTRCRRMQETRSEEREANAVCCRGSDDRDTWQEIMRDWGRDAVMERDLNSRS